MIIVLKFEDPIILRALKLEYGRELVNMAKIEENMAKIPKESRKYCLLDFHLDPPAGFF